MADDDARRDESSDAAQPPAGDHDVDDRWGAGVDWAVPDDIRELEADIRAYRREQRRSARHGRTSRLLARPATIPLVVVAIALTLAGSVAALLTVFAPRTGDSDASPLPLAHSTVAAGQVGSLLPAVSLVDVEGGVTGSRALRPAVLAIVPAACDCTPLLRQIAGAAYGNALSLDVVVPAADSEVKALPEQLSAARTRVLVDAHATLASTFGATGVTVVLLARNGEVYDVQRSVTSITGIEPELGSMRIDARFSG
jgi:hypothetical protein